MAAEFEVTWDVIQHISGVTTTFEQPWRLVPVSS
jgi:hypothetical protein